MTDNYRHDATTDEAGRNPHGYFVEEWSAQYDLPHHLFPGYAGQPQSCPRRIEGAYQHLIDGAGLPDRWEPREHGMGQEPAVGLSCSYCGSLHPGRLLQLLGEGWIIGPTDKGYKAYLDRPYTDEQNTTRKQQWLDTSAEAAAVRSVGEKHGHTPQQVTTDLDNLYAEMNLSGGATVAKVYFQHLVAVGGVDAFCELHNNGAMRIGYPGRFYVKPYFSRPGPATP